MGADIRAAGASLRFIRNVHCLPTCIVKVLRVINRVLQKALERLEPYVGKLTSTVLRGARELVTVLWDGNNPRLLDCMQAKADIKKLAKFALDKKDHLAKI